MGRVKVFNDNKHHVGVKLENGTTRDVAPRSFAILTDEDVAFIMSTSALFANHHLSIKDEKVIEDLGVSKEEVSFDSDEEILAKLKKSNIVGLKKYLADIKEPHLRQRVIELVKGNDDLSLSKVKVVEEAFKTEIR